MLLTGWSAHDWPLPARLLGAFVHGYEEPALRRRFGAEYDAYRRAVPAWWPRRTPWWQDRER